MSTRQSMIINFWLAGFLCSGILAASAATHYLVPTNNTGGAINPYTDWGTAGTSVIDVVNAAMTNASSPRIVLVSNGVYMLTSTVTITNDVVLKSVNGRDAAIFNGNALYNFKLQNTNSVLDGLTITNGRGINFGGGIAMSGGTVTNCLITDCVAPASRSAGIDITGPSTVANCTIRRNQNLTSGAAGAISIPAGGGPAIIMNCIIENNILNGSGAITIASVRGVIIRNCLIVGNNAGVGTYYGGGIDIGATNVLVANCTIVSNYAGIGGGINFRSFDDPAHTNTVVNCIIVSNIAPSGGANTYDMGTTKHKYAIGYSCSTLNNNTFVIDGRGNTTSDPKFTSFTTGNFRFNRTSPCFNSGTNQPDWMTGAVDLDGHRRILHGTADMGAYELFIPSGAMYRFR